MKASLDILLKVKTVKEEKAQRALLLKSEEARRAKEETLRAKEVVRASASTLEARQDKVYADLLIGKIVKRDAIDDAKSRIAVIQGDHGKLLDAETKAVHLEATAEQERKDAAEHHRAARKKTDKYKIMTDMERVEREAEFEKKEEAEIEEVAGNKRRVSA